MAYYASMSDLDNVLGVVSQTRVSGGNRTHDPYANSLALYPLDYQGTLREEILNSVGSQNLRGLNMLSGALICSYVAIEQIPTRSCT